MPNKKKKAFESFKKKMTEKGLKWTRQREIIAKVFLESREHMKVDELLNRVRRADSRISQATVYRTLKILKNFGLAEERRFNEEQTLYESSTCETMHHDHLICTKCHKIVEFVHGGIESLQEEVALHHGFKVSNHKLEIYGICSECSKR